MIFRQLREFPQYTEELLYKMSVNSDWTIICDWLKEQTVLTFRDTLPDITLAFENDELIGFYVITEYEMIKEKLDITPFLTQILIFDGYRKKGYSVPMINNSIERTRALGYDVMYLTTDHDGLYEAYGFEQIGTATYIWHEPTILYRKYL